ncbi:MAG: choice-of-anchor J domain-containing protein [Prevotellaceae bacterium]|jgi:gliding motility-associated-like protein|nr:choice-of-anchor J domain-containing protein [Prevotellaceae bacterium]
MKKLRFILSVVWLLVFGLISVQTNAQQTKGGVPPTFLVKEAQALPAQAYVKMPVNFSVKEMLTADEFNAKNGINRPRYARDIPADITMENSGVWTELPDGRKVWRVAIEASNAKAITIRYEEFYLPAGSQLFLYSADKTHLLKSYNNTSNPRGKEFVTPLVAGEVVILEYVAPLTETGDKARINIVGVGYGYNHIKIEKKSDFVTQLAGESGSCQVNVVCSPEGDNWQDQSKSVCAIYIYTGVYNEICSGTLINNTANDGKPYIISAFHCYEDYESYLPYYAYRFFFESKTCVGNTGYDDDDEYFVGCVKRASIPMNGGSDGYLVELDDPIPDEWIASRKIIFAGWDRRDDPSVVAQSGVKISHPALDVKKIATYSSPATIGGGYNWGGPVSAPNAHWEVEFVQTENGWSESQGGSSGSGLLNQDGVLIGTLSGGPGGNICSPTGGNRKWSYFGGLYYHWDKYGSDASTQMKTWLDPVGGGTAETCDAYPAKATSADFTGNPTSIYAMESVKFAAATTYIDSVKWEFEGGTPATSTEVTPTIQYLNDGVFDVKLTAYGKSNITENDTVIVVEKADYITVTIKGGNTALAPVANLAALQPTTVWSDNVTTPPTTVIRVGATGANTATYNKEGHSWFYASEVDNQLWIRRNTAYSGANPVPYGASGEGDYYYCFYYPTSSPYWARMWNREAFDMSSYSSATLKFKFFSATWAGDADALSVKYRTSSGSAWTEIFLHPLDNPTTAWQEVEVNLPNLSSTYQIAFEGTTGWGYGLALDDVVVLGLSPATTSVILWEGDAVDYVDQSTGPAVLYEYTFEGGTPATSTDTVPIIRVQYNVGNTTNYTGAPSSDYYDTKQWIKNTLGEDDTTLVDYVIVIGRKLDTDKDTILGDCGAAINETITLTANRSWTLTAPAWLTVTPTSGTIATAGVEETFTITVTAPVNTTYSGNSGYIEFTSDDGKVVTRVRVEQSTPKPNTPTAVRYDSINAKITWDGVGCLIYEVPASECDIINFTGDFETAPSGWLSAVGGEGAGWELGNNAALFPEFAHTGERAMYSKSYDNSTGPIDADNWLITPKLRVTSTYHTLKYWISSQDATYPDHYEVLLSTNESVSSTGDFTDVIKAMAIAPTGPADANYYEEVSIDLSAYIGQNVFIAFHHEDIDAYWLKLDDVSGLDLASCVSTQSYNGIEPDAASGVFKTPQLSLKKATVITKYKITKDGELKAVGKQQSSQLVNGQNSVSSLVEAFESGNIQKVDWTKEEFKAEQLQLQSVPLVPQALVMSQLRKCTPTSTNAIRYNSYLAPNSLFVGVHYTEQELKDLFDPCGDGYPITLKSITISMYSRKDISLGVWKNGVRIVTQAVSATNINNGSLTYPPTVAPTTIILNTPVELSGPGDVYIGYTATQTITTSEFPYGLGSAPVVAGGSVYSKDGGNTWTNDLDGTPASLGDHYIIGNVEIDDAILSRPIGYYKLYRQRLVNGIPVGEPKSFIVVDTVYDDQDIQPGGEYCYWTTFVSNGTESCASDTSCVFILYQQEILPVADIDKVYGDPAFKLDKAGTDGHVIKSTVDDIDYFANRTIPVKLEIVSGNSVALSGVESDYRIDLLRAGVTVLKATQEAGIPDTLLPAEPVEFAITVEKGDIYVIAPQHLTREEGEVNPNPFDLTYQSFFYSDNVSTLDVTPTVTCVATPLSPVGEYAIVVHVGLDQRYNVIPVNGILEVTESTVIPNAFTPNSDGYNDAFLPGHRVQIFNRYGVLIYQSKNKDEINRGWNGRNQKNDKLVDPGVYYYILTDESGKIVRKGSVNVVKK